MKVSSDKVAEHRNKLLDTAKRLLQERGFAGAGVVDISREAGLTQGALYSQFKSKELLTAEAIRKAFADGAVTWGESPEPLQNTLAAYLDAYLSQEHLEEVGAGCPVAACVSEIRHQGCTVGAAFTEGFLTMVANLQGALPEELSPAQARARALTLASALVGSVALARAVETTDPELAKEIIAASRGELGTLGIS